MTDAEAVLPVVPFSVVDTNPVTLFHAPWSTPVTVTENVQLPPAARDPPVTAIVRDDAVRVRLFVPPQTDCVPSVMLNPTGMTSLIEIPLRATFPTVVFEIVNDNVDVEPAAIVVGENDFVMVGAGTGSAQPVRVIESYSRAPPTPSTFAPDPVNLMKVFPDAFVLLVKSTVWVVKTSTGFEIVNAET